MTSAQAHMVIDEETRFHERRTLEPETLRNTHASISWLPEEMLLAVFVEVQRDARLKEWHRIAQVCWRWRTVAIGAPILWTKLETRNYEYTMLFIARSGIGTLLDIFLERDVPAKTLAVLLDHIERIGSINIQYTRPICLQDIETILQKSKRVPSRLWKVNIWSFDTDPNKCTFSTKTLNYPARLQILELKGIDLDWNMLPLPQLITLSLRGVHSLTPLSWQQFFYTLHEMPLLQNLRFDTHALGLHSPSSHIKGIELHHLCNLSINGCTLADIPFLVCRIVAPQLRYINVSCGGNGMDYVDADFSETTRALSALIRQGSFSAFDKACISSTAIGFHMELSAHENYLAFSLPYSLNQDYSAGADTLYPRIIRTLLHDIDHIPQENIVKLVLDVQLTAEGLVDLFGHLPRLESIKAYDITVQEVIDSIQIPISHDLTDPIPFKHLQSLSLESEDIQEHYMYDPCVWRDLCDILMLRCEYGVPLHHLSVRCRAISTKKLRLLQEIVVDLDYPDDFYSENSDFSDSDY